MSRRAHSALVSLLLVSIFVSVSSTGSVSASSLLNAPESLQVAFAPWDDVESLVMDVIAGAHKQIRMQAYLLTSKKIVTTLVAAHRRGVDVQILVDAEQLAKVPSSAVPDLAAAGIAVWLETRYQNAHNKIIVVDADTSAATVVTGSFNFTWTAQNRNAENVLIVRNNAALAARYAKNWERHRQDATPYKR